MRKSDSADDPAVRVEGLRVVRGGRTVLPDLSVAVPRGQVVGLLAERNWTGTVVVEVNTRRARTRDQRESDLAEALAFARLHLATPAPSR